MWGRDPIIITERVSNRFHGILVDSRLVVSSYAKCVNTINEISFKPV